MPVPALHPAAAAGELTAHAAASEASKRPQLPPNPSNTLLHLSRQVAAVRLALPPELPLSKVVLDSPKPPPSPRGVADLQPAPPAGAASAAPALSTLAKWLECQALRFNTTYAARPDDKSAVEFLMLAVAHGSSMYAQAHAELTQLVAAGSPEQAHLLGHAWSGYSYLMAHAAGRLHEAYQSAKAAAESAETRAEALELELMQEHEIHEEHKGELQEELARLHAQVAELVTSRPAGSSAAADGGAPPPGEPAGAGGDPQPAPLPRLSGARLSGSLHARESAFRASSQGAKPSFALRGSMAPGRKGTAALEYGGRQGSASAKPSGVGSVFRHMSDAMQGLEADDLEAARAENAMLREAVDTANRELYELYRRMADLEGVAGDVVELEGRVEAAEAERDDALDRLAVCTPRPPSAWARLLERAGDAAASKLRLAAERCKSWPPGQLADVLRGTAPLATLHPRSAVGCLTGAAEAGHLSREDLRAALAAGDCARLEPFITSGEAKEWLAEALPPPEVDLEATCCLLLGVTSEGLRIEPEAHGCLAHLAQAVSSEEVASALRSAGVPTSQWVGAMEAEHARLGQACRQLEGVVSTYKEQEQRREVGRLRREEEALLERKSVVQQYVEMLSTQNEDTWREMLIGMGAGTDVPKVFRHAGKIRNKQLPKRDTEKLVKEVWKARMSDSAASAGKAGELVDFLGTFLQKKVGILSAVVELAYNFLYGLWKYQWDADCELFLKVLQGEVKEDVYVAQVRLQEEMEELFDALDRAKGSATGTIPKADLRAGLMSFFRVGQPGGKTLARFDELMQALDEDQAGPMVEWKKVFEEDREFNQGEFAESVRDQFLQERIDYFKALEEAVYDQADHGEACTKQHVVNALLLVDTEMNERQAQHIAASVFPPDVDALGIKAVIKKISRGIVRGTRASTAKLSVTGRLKAGGAKPSLQRSALAAGANKVQSEKVAKALEAVRLAWITRQI